ncbi:MAG: beta-lactamase family protein, partial [Verrucomicrobiae bacterium]|nr:beta-lactamase family protein [Verrucomicrobiae bacterium]
FVITASFVIDEGVLTAKLPQGEGAPKELTDLPPQKITVTLTAGADDITVWNLVDHVSGFPEYKPDNDSVGSLLGLGRPASFAELIAWQSAQPLLFPPGTGSQYSNFGYGVLGVVIEKVTGMSYGAYLRQIFSETLEAHSLRVPPELQITNPVPTTTLLAETYANNAAAGGVQISSSDLCRIMRAYRLNGDLKPQPVPSGGFFFTFFGSVPGGMSVVNQRISGGTGTEFAISCNSRGEVSNDYLKNSVIAALDALPVWPTNDLFPSLDWKMDNFWNAAIGDMATNSAFVEDFDGDSIQNLGEYAFGLNAKLPDPAVPTAATVSLVAGQLEFRVPKVPTRVDCAMDLLISTNMTQWIPVVSVVGESLAMMITPGFTLVEAGSGPSRTLTLQRPQFPGEAKLFFRWLLRLHDPGL